jgi:type IV secretory pathway VirJ component
VKRSNQPLDLPLYVLDAKPAMNTMAVIYSGDGGWRDLDSEVGGYLQSQGVPTIGLDSLRYFWSERTPQQTADDLAKIIEHYRRQWGVQNVMLIGYSFGADVLPATYNLLPPADRARVKQITLLGFSKTVDYEISVTGWLGIAGGGKEGDPMKDIAKIDPKIIQCVYGTDEDDDPCPTLKDKGVEVVAIEGGHHFDENYQALGKRIRDSLQTRLSK